MSAPIGLNGRTVEVLNPETLRAEIVQVATRETREERAHERAKRREETRESWGAVELAAAEAGLPLIVTADTPLAALTTQTIDAIAAANTPPVVFTRAGGLARVVTDETGRPLIETLDRNRLRGIAARCACWVTAGRNGAPRVVFPPLDVMADVLARPGWPFPALAGLTATPILHRDGSIVAVEGYDPVSRLLYMPALAMPAIPPTPSGADVAAARDLVLDLISDFPFASDADRAAALALLLTVALRPLIAGPVPAFLLDKTKAGTGATLLADVAALIGTGRPGAMLTLPPTDEALEKLLTALLIPGAPLILADNIDRELRSGVLASALTADTYAARILGRSEIVSVPQRSVFVFTGNNIQLRGDIARRSIWCRMDAKTARPWEREGFRHPDLRGYVTEQRGAIVAAILTLARAWIRAGSPAPSVRPLGGFEIWTRTIGGILECAGVPGFLTNLSALYEQADAESAEWAAFLAAIQDAIHGPFTVSELVKMIEDDDDLRAAAPGDLLGRDGKSPNPRSIGKQFARRVDTRYDGRRLTRHRERQRAVMWLIAEDHDDAPGEFGESGEFNPPTPRGKTPGTTTYRDVGETNSSDSLTHQPDRCAVAGCSAEADRFAADGTGRCKQHQAVGTNGRTSPPPSYAAERLRRLQEMGR